MKRTKKQEKPATTGAAELDTRARRRAIERWENEGGSPEPSPAPPPRTPPQGRTPASRH